MAKGAPSVREGPVGLARIRFFKDNIPQTKARTRLDLREIMYWFGDTRLDRYVDRALVQRGAGGPMPEDDTLFVRCSQENR